MTLPDERYRAVIETKKFLESIITTRSGLSKEMKETARWCLRHYPSEYDLDRVSENSPDVFQRRMEDVTRMFKAYEEKKNEQV
jgi:excinuclease UvrABC nuclease subunit